MFNRLTPLLVAALCLSGCAEDNRDQAKKALESTLSVGYQVEYGELNNYPGRVVCGEYSAIARYGERGGLAPFIYLDGEVLKVPSEDDLAIFCSEDPAAELAAHLGLSANKDNSSLAAIRADFSQIDQALQAYLRDNANYPVTAQGLEALRTASETSPRPLRFREGGYISEIPVDPWGRPYRYSSEEALRTEPRVFSLATLGKDGVQGGAGDNADVSNLHLKYLDHLARLK